MRRAREALASEFNFDLPTIIQNARERQESGGRPAGRITPQNWLYYPLCTAWVGLGTAMIVLPVLAFFRGQLYARLAAYCCAALLLLTAVTVGAALWSGS